MTNYDRIDQMWGGVQKEWKVVRLQDKYLSSVLMVAAWTGMIAFFIFGTLSLVTKSHGITLWMLASLILWVTSGIAAVRIRRVGRKLIAFDK